MSRSQLELSGNGRRQEGASGGEATATYRRGSPRGLGPVWGATPQSTSSASVRQGRSTYDDLLRLAELTLRCDGVVKLYRRHFGCIVVDEFQDLTPQQLRVIQRVGYRRTTYAGDIAQGIYSFAGADPDAVLAAIKDETRLELPLNESYRSSPAVLTAVNSLNAMTGGAVLRAALPETWPGVGLATGLAFTTVAEESAWVVDFATRILEGAPLHRVGIIARSGGRRRFVDEAVAATRLPWRRWDDPLMDAATSGHMKKVVARVRVEDFQGDEGGIGYLVEQAKVDLLEEPDTRKGVMEALGWMADELNEGVPLADIAGRIKVAQSTQLLDAPGVHLLSGHVGKGQQFDWVVVVGLEEDACLTLTRRRTRSCARKLGCSRSCCRAPVTASRSLGRSVCRH